MFKKDESAATERYVGGRIDSTCAVTGTFERVYQETATTGSKAVVFDFLSDQGQEATIKVWYYTGKDGGSDLQSGIDEIQGKIMVLLNVDSLKEKPNTIIEKYDYDLKANKDVKVTSYPQLQGKRIGIVFQETIEKYNDMPRKGSWFTHKFNAVRYFDAETQQTAEEVVNDKPSTLDAYMDKLADVYIPSKIKYEYLREQSSDAQVMEKAKTQQPTATYIPPSSDNFDDDDDEIPF